MKSMPWIGRPAWRRGLVSVLGAAALALGATACTKDAGSQAPTTSTDSASTANAPAQPVEGAAAAAVPGAATAADPQAGGQGAGDSSYALKVDAPPKLASGAEGTVRVSVVPAAGWKMNHEFPTKLEVTAPEGVTVAQAKQSIADAERFEDAGATFAVKFTAQSAGEKAFQAKFRFAVCTDATCVPKSQELAWAVEVE